MEWELFAGIPGDDVRAVLALARRATYRRGEVVFHRYDPADSLHLVVKGRFDVRITTQLGDVVALGIHGPGATFGELAVVTGAERSATVTALEPGETLVLRGSELRRLARKHASVDEVLVRALAEQVSFLSERLVEAYTVDAETRVARRVLELARVYGRGAADGDPPHPGGSRGARRHVARDRQPGARATRRREVSSSCTGAGPSSSTTRASPGSRASAPDRRTRRKAACAGTLLGHRRARLAPSLGPGAAAR